MSFDSVIKCKNIWQYRKGTTGEVDRCSPFRENLLFINQNDWHDHVCMLHIPMSITFHTFDRYVELNSIMPQQLWTVECDNNLTFIETHLTEKIISVKNILEVGIIILFTIDLHVHGLKRGKEINEIISHITTI